MEGLKWVGDKYDIYIDREGANMCLYIHLKYTSKSIDVTARKEKSGAELR